MKPTDVKIELYHKGMELLAQSGIFNYVRQFGRVRDMGVHDHMMNSQFAEAHRSMGFNDALDQILGFERIHLAPEKPVEKPTMDYGALAVFRKMLAQKLITKERYDELARHPAFNPGN